MQIGNLDELAGGSSTAMAMVRRTLSRLAGVEGREGSAGFARATLNRRCSAFGVRIEIADRLSGLLGLRGVDLDELDGNAQR